MNAPHHPPATHRPRPAWLLPVLGTCVGLGAWLLLRVPAGSDAPLEGPAPRTTPVRPEGEAGASAAPRPEVLPPQDEPLVARTPAAAPQVRGLVLDTTERPIAGARLTLCAVDPGALRGLVVPDGLELGGTSSASDGTFALPAPLTGVARVSATAPGHGRATQLVSPAGARLTLVLAREALLEVLARGPDGRPAVAGQVQVEVDGSRHSQALEAGRARLEGLPAGAARVRVRTPEGGVGEAGPLLLEVGTTREVLVVLVAGARLGGLVRDEETDEPLAGARVIVAQPGRSLGETVTDGAGRFGPLLAGAPGAAVQLSVQAPEHADALLALTLSEGPEATEVEVRLRPAEPWTGRVEHPDGAAAAAVEVGYTPDGIVGRAPASTTTDAEGRFALPPPPPPAPGRRIVLVARSGAALAALALRPDTPRPDPLVLRLVRGASLSGRVLDDHGRALEGVLVRAQPAWSLARASGPGSDLLHAINSGTGGGLTGLTAGDGTFEIVGLPSGPWWVTLEHQGAARAVGEPVQVEAADVPLGDLMLGGELTLEGSVLTPEGAPLAEVRVRLGATARAGERPQSALTDLSGRFRFTDLAPERVWVEVEGAPAPGAGLREELDLPARGPLTFRVARGRRLTLDLSGPDGRVSGLVTLVLARPRAGEAGGYRASASAEAGEVVFHDVPPGHWILRAEAGPLLAAPRELLEVAAERDGRLALRLAAPALLEGLLRTASGAPVAGGEILIGESATGRARRRTLSDGEGRYRFTGLAAGEHDLLARGPGGAPVELRLGLSEGRTTTQDLSLAPAGGLRLRALDERGRPLSGALVSVRAAEGRVAGASAQGRTDANGRLELANLPQTALLVTARTRDGLVGTQRVELTTDLVLDLELTLARR